MLQKSVITAAAWLEIVTGSAFVMVPDVLCRLLLAATPEGIGRLLGRFAGIALLALGITCLPSRVAESRSRAVQGLLAYNVGVTILLSWVGIATMFRGVLLWPVVVLHAVIAVGLLAGIF
jgi:hypothetical protein